MNEHVLDNLRPHKDTKLTMHDMLENENPPKKKKKNVSSETIIG